MQKYLKATFPIILCMLIGSCVFSNANSESTNSSLNEESKDSNDLIFSKLGIKNNKFKMESEDLEFVLDINDIEVDSRGWVRLRFARDDFETIEFLDPESIRYLSLHCRNSERLPAEILLFKRLTKLLILGGNFSDIGIELNELNSLQNVAFASSNLKSFPVSLLSSPSILIISMLGNLYPISVPEDLCNVKKEMLMYFIGTTLIDKNNCLQNNPNLIIVR